MLGINASVWVQIQLLLVPSKSWNFKRDQEYGVAGVLKTLTLVYCAYLPFLKVTRFCRIWSQTWQCGSWELYHLHWLHLKAMFRRLIHIGTCLAWATRTIPRLRMCKRLLSSTTTVSQNHGCRLGLSISVHFGPSMLATLTSSLVIATSWSSLFNITEEEINLGFAQAPSVAGKLVVHISIWRGNHKIGQMAVDSMSKIPSCSVLRSCINSIRYAIHSFSL